ncbi:MAG: STAS domain-containing protein [Bacteroidales bacterium]
MVIYSYEEKLHSLTCSFEGKLDTLSSEKLQREVTKTVEKHRKPLRVVFDFADVSFITSAFVRVCVTTARMTGAENFSIVNTNPLIKKTLKIAGLDQQLNVT